MRQLVVRQVARVMELAVARRRFPGGHNAPRCVVLDRRCPDTGLLIRVQRERPDVPFPMTNHAVLFQEWGDVSCPGVAGGGLGGGSLYRLLIPKDIATEGTG